MGVPRGHESFFTKERFTEERAAFRSTICSATAAPQNQLQLANCSRLKICVVGCEVLQGVGA
jgi:hypothetical protein